MVSSDVSRQDRAVTQTLPLPGCRPTWGRYLL